MYYRGNHGASFLRLLDRSISFSRSLSSTSSPTLPLARARLAPRHHRGVQLRASSRALYPLVACVRVRACDEAFWCRKRSRSCVLGVSAALRAAASSSLSPTTSARLPRAGSSPCVTLSLHRSVSSAPLPSIHRRAPLANARTSSLRRHQAPPLASTTRPRSPRWLRCATATAIDPSRAVLASMPTSTNTVPRSTGTTTTSSSTGGASSMLLARDLSLSLSRSLARCAWEEEPTY